MRFPIAMTTLALTVALVLPSSSTTFASRSVADNASVAAEQAAELEPGSCYATVDNPHISSGAGGKVIAKIRFRCDVGYSITFNEWIGNLYRCSSKPAFGSAESTWTSQNGCVSVATNSSTSDGGPVPVSSGGTVTRYIPKTGGATPVKAWYIACVRGYKGSGNTPFRNTSLPVSIG